MILMIVLIYTVSCIDVKTESVQCPIGCMCNAQIQSVTCLNLGDTSVTDLLMMVPLSTTKLTIRGAKLDHIPMLSFLGNLHNLTYLEISNSSVSTISKSAFSFLFSLRELRLNSNKLRTVSGDNFRHLHKLQELDLSDNNIEDIDPSAFLPLMELQYLNLQHNSLQTVPPTIFQTLTKLVRLDVSHNRINYLHPKVFMKLSMLNNLHLAHNNLDYLHKHLLHNLTSLIKLSLENNPWDCTCGIKWLVHKMHCNTSFTNRLLDDYGLTCSSPPHLSGVHLAKLAEESLHCASPTVDQFTPEVTVTRLGDSALYCNASGVPQPSIYWITPNGRVLASHDNRKWINPDIHDIQSEYTYAGKPTFYKSKLDAQSEGVLNIRSFRFYHVGVYRCVAENPAGMDSANVTVAIYSPIKTKFLESVFWGWAGAVGFLTFSLVFGIIRCFVERHNERTLIKKNKSMDQHGIEVMLDSEGQYPGEDDPWDDRDEDYRGSPNLGYSKYDLYYSPYDSPIKCTTPVEDGKPGTPNIKETLEDVRYRLRSGIERQKERVRTRAANIRVTGSHYVQNVRDRAHSLRESGSHYVHTIRSSSSQYANKIRHSGTVAATRLRSGGSHYAQRVRTGVVMGVEQVKYHVKSMKELCGTGDISHTISTVSVSTDIDSDKTMEVVKTVTYV